MNKLIFFLFSIILLLIGSVFAECFDGQIDINTASATELDKIIYVGPTTAAKIIEARPFNSVDNLINVSGIGEIKLNAIKNENLACVSSEAKEEIKETETEEIDIMEEILEKENTETSSASTISLVNNSSEIKELQVIKLNSKDIKEENSTQENKEGNFIEKYAGFGLMALCILLLILLFLQNKNGLE
ncbi:MAG: helix-hairpin-helix domain-containing protein [archaeon]